MKTIKRIEDVLKDGNSTVNQRIKGDFIGKHVYCNVNSMAEYCLSKGHEDNESPIQYEEIENLYSLPEWSGTVLGESLYFGGGSEEDRETFLEEFDRLTEESERMFEAEEISEVTHERNLELIEEAKREVNDLESEPQEIFEWWAVSEFLYRKLKENGYCVVDAGSCYVWGRTCTGQAILLDHVITLICADMGILEGQENEW